MASALVQTVRPAPAGQAKTRILVLRSCRTPEFEAAVRLAQARHPEAEIVALSHEGHRAALDAIGVDRIVEIPGHRFGLLRTSPWTLARLRDERFDEVVIPQMSALDDMHVNLYWLVAALRCDRAVIVAPDRTPRDLARPAFLRYMLRMTASGLLFMADAPVLLMLLAAACVVRALRGLGPPKGGHYVRRDGRGGDVRSVRLQPDHTPARKRVLHVISSLGVGGAQVQLAEVLNRTPRDQYDVELLVLGRSDGDFSRQWLNRDDVEITYLDQWPRLSPSVLEIASRCRARRYDLVHTWLFMANVVAAAGARLAGVPHIIASVRNLSVWKREAWYRKWWHRAADILGSNAADVVTVNAQALVADHAEWAWTPRSRIQVIHNGLDPSRFLVDRRESRRLLLEATNMPEDALIVGTVGRLAPEKDQATFIRMIAEARKWRPQIRGVVIGDGELRPHLEALATKHFLDVDQGIVFLGERADARRLMAGLDLFVLTSLSEGFPNVLLEATFLGVPCVATNLAGNPEVLRSDEALFLAGNVNDGAMRILSWLADREWTSSRQQFVRKRAMELFTAERSVSSWLALYRRTLGDA